MASRLRRSLRAYRVADGRRPIFDGTGAALHGGRWNSSGRRVIYSAETYAGALLEILVHTNIGRLPKHLTWIEIKIPAGVSRESVGETDLPSWDDTDQAASRANGDAWYDQRRTAVLLAPSLVTRVERNILLNPEHPDFAKINASPPRPVVWDERLFRRSR